ncbi:MAG: CDP-glucose 4,6-dehydratase [Acidobacteriaceae bacterium]
MEFRQSSVESVELNPEFWRNKRVLLTGHTGFKGSWLSLWLQSLGAELAGYSLPPPTEPSLYLLAGVEEGMQSIRGDILDLQHLRRVVGEFQPQIVFHMAAQSLVRRSYDDPVGTFSTNVLGTAHVLEAVRSEPRVQAVVIVTSDKCYENGDCQANGDEKRGYPDQRRENQRYENHDDEDHDHEDLGRQRAFREGDRLGGFDPYSSSKAAAELVTAAFRQSFFSSAERSSATGIASARAGNVLGGGDFAPGRLIPDVMRAAIRGEELLIRNPHAVRPWQHVLDPLSGYLMLAEKLCADPHQFSEAWNFGPDPAGALSVSAVLDRLRSLWGPAIAWRVDGKDHPHEAAHLSLDSAKAKSRLGWTPQWNLKVALEATVRWYKAYQAHQDQAHHDLRGLAQEQIQSFQSQSFQIQSLQIQSL